MPRRGEAQTKLAQLSRAAKLNPSSVAAHMKLAGALMSAGRPSDALASYDAAIALKPDYPQAHFNRGMALSALGRGDAALASVESAIAMGLEHPQAHKSRARLLGRLGRHESALASLDRALALAPGDADAHFERGLLLGVLGRAEEAVAALEQCVALDCDDAARRDALGSALRVVGRFAEAEAAHVKAIELAPRQPGYYLSLVTGRRIAAADPWLARMEALERDAASLAPGQVMRLKFALAKAYDDVGRPDEAFARLIEANRLKRASTPYDEGATLGFFDRVRESFDRQPLARSRPDAASSELPVFIIGMPRSGTTLIEQIIASHPKAAGAGELTDLGAIATELAGGTDEGAPSRLAGLGDATLREAGERYVARLRRHGADARRIVDKMPSNYLLAGFIHLALPNARIIHVTRDPMDTCFSCFSKLFVAGQEHTYDLAELGRYYRKYAELMDHWRAALPPGRMLEVAYEDVVGDLEDAARRLIDHCGLDWDARCLAFHDTDRPIRTASAEQVRRPIYASSIGRWRAYRQHLGPLMAALGR